MTTSTPPRRPPRRTGGGAGGGWAPALTPQTAVRIAILGGIAMSLLGILLVRLWFLQVISSEEYAAKAEGNRLRTVITQPARGNILTRDGQPLVQNKLGENIVASPRDLTGENRTVVLTRLARKLSQLGEPVTPKELIAKVKAGDNRPLESVILAENIEPRLYRYMAERRRDFPGIQLEQSYLRAYPEGQLAAHVLGTTGRIGPSQIAAYRKAGYSGNETIGVGGVEQTYEKFLAGTPGETVVEVDASGEPQGRGYVSSKSPVPGRNIELSIDGPTQKALEGAIAEATRVTGAQGAAGVALDPRTGEVLAMASYPTYSPNVFVTRNAKRIAALNNDPERPAVQPGHRRHLSGGLHLQAHHGRGGAQAGRPDPRRADRVALGRSRSTSRSSATSGATRTASSRCRRPSRCPATPTSTRWPIASGSARTRRSGCSRCRTRRASSAWARRPASTCRPTASPPAWCPTRSGSRRSSRASSTPTSSAAGWPATPSSSAWARATCW